MATKEQVKVNRLQVPDIGDLLDERYRIQGVMATGGMGVILKAQQLPMERTVAIKLLHPHIAAGNETVIGRFEQEVRLAKMLNHPNTIRLYDFGESGEGLIYVAMEYLEGLDLKALLAEEGALPLGRAVDITRQMLDGLAEAHAHDIIHRDLKPSNVFVTANRRGDDFVKLLDFGIAKSLDGANLDLTADGGICGTPSYVAPEYLMGAPLEKASDVYAVGLMLLEMLTGKRVFEADAPAQTLMMHLQIDPTIPTEIIDTPLADIIRKATVKTSAERYADADEMLHALEQIADELPADLRIESPPESASLEPSSDVEVPEAVEAVEAGHEEEADADAKAPRLKLPPLRPTKKSKGGAVKLPRPKSPSTKSSGSKGLSLPKPKRAFAVEATAKADESQDEVDEVSEVEELSAIGEVSEVEDVGEASEASGSGPPSLPNLSEPKADPEELSPAPEFDAASESDDALELPGDEDEEANAAGLSEGDVEDAFFAHDDETSEDEEAWDEFDVGSSSGDLVARAASALGWGHLPRDTQRKRVYMSAAGLLAAVFLVTVAFTALGTDESVRGAGAEDANAQTADAEEPGSTPEPTEADEDPVALAAANSLDAGSDAAEAQPLTFTFQTEPSGATVRVAGAEIGQTPLSHEIYPDELPATVSFELEGYEEASAELSSESSESIVQQLEAKPAPKQASASAATRSGDSSGARSLRSNGGKSKRGGEGKKDKKIADEKVEKVLDEFLIE